MLMTFRVNFVDYGLKSQSSHSHDSIEYKKYGVLCNDQAVQTISVFVVPRDRKPSHPVGISRSHDMCIDKVRLVPILLLRADSVVDAKLNGVSPADGSKMTSSAL